MSHKCSLECSQLRGSAKEINDLSPGLTYVSLGPTAFSEPNINVLLKSNEEEGKEECQSQRLGEHCEKLSSGHDTATALVKPQQPSDSPSRTGKGV